MAQATIVQVLMPRLSDSMEEGIIVSWLAEHGDTVEAGQELVEIETDKATMMHEAESDGVLEIVAEAGATIPLGELIARIHPDGTSLPAGESNGSGAEASPSPTPTPSETLQPERPGSRPDVTGRVPASPVARRLARSLGVELGAIVGSGPRGRVVKADVEAAHASQAGSGVALQSSGTPSVGKPALAPTGPTPSTEDRLETAKGETTTVELSRLQQTVARRMAESKATAPDFALQIEIDMTAAVSLRASLKNLAGEEVVPTYNDMVVKACALALRSHPRANGAYRDGLFELYSRVNVGIAVAVDDGLLVPTVPDADIQSLGQIARTSRELAARARDGTLTAAELGGGTFTVSNLGMFGISSFTAVINPPQAGILAIGAIESRPAFNAEGELVSMPTLTATLSADHRILYGADAANFLAEVRDRLQRPMSLLL
jgi:pyruvate dehydrogenase E2 component (dihydrolipoyllysine-residue acetyltransferase)